MGNICCPPAQTEDIAFYNGPPKLERTLSIKNKEFYLKKMLSANGKGNGHDADESINESSSSSDDENDNGVKKTD